MIFVCILLLCWLMTANCVISVKIGIKIRVQLYSPKAGVHYWECVSYARLRIRVVSQPFCVDQLNPAGFNVSNVLIRKTPALFLHGKLEIYKQIWRRRICRRRHLLPGQPVTLTMTFPLRILLKMKTKIHTLKLPVINHHQTQKQKAMQSLKSAGVRRCQRQSQSRSELDQDLIP